MSQRTTPSSQLRTVTAPMRSRVRIRGSLAPQGAVLHQGHRTRKVYMGPARVFENGDEATAAVAAGEIEPGDVVVIRGQSASVEDSDLSSVTSALEVQRLDEDVALVTDGPCPATGGGTVVGEVSPAATAGGPLAWITDGEPVRIDVREGRVDVLVDLAGRVAGNGGPVRVSNRPTTFWMSAG